MKQRCRKNTNTKTLIFRHVIKLTLIHNSRIVKTSAQLISRTVSSENKYI